MEPNKAPAVVQTTFPPCKTSRPQGDPELAADLQRCSRQARCARIPAQARHVKGHQTRRPNFLPNAERPHQTLNLVGRDARAGVSAPRKDSWTGTVARFGIEHVSVAG